MQNVAPKPQIDSTKTVCPHCGSDMLKWRVPPDSTWGVPYKFVCFNDECQYFVKGWKHMLDNYQQRASYRHSYDPFTQELGPLPVWSFTALKSGIIKDGEK